MFAFKVRSSGRVGVIINIRVQFRVKAKSGARASA
jgi:hypothetical protein